MHKVLTFPQSVTTVEDGQVKEALAAQSDITWIKDVPVPQSEYPSFLPKCPPPSPQKKYVVIVIQLPSRVLFFVTMNCSTPGFPVLHIFLPCPPLSSWVCPNSCPLSQWCHPTISSSVIPFSSCPQFFPASGSFPMSQLFAASAEVNGRPLQYSCLENPKDSMKRQIRTPSKKLASLNPDRLLLCFTAAW